jgi:hypothetical protein
MKFSKKEMGLILICFLIFFGFSTRALALEIAWPSIPGGTVLTDDSTVTEMISWFYEWGITIGGIATFFALVLAGFKYLTSAGNPSAMGQAVNQIQSALFGLILLLSSWLILNIINPELTVLRTPEFTGLDVDMPYAELDEEKIPVCEWARVYRRTGWQGGTRELVIPDDETESDRIKFSPRSYIFFRRRIISKTPCNPADPPPAYTECVATGNPEMPNALLEECNPSTEHCEERGGVLYKEGGACVLELYFESTWWILPTGGCGDKMGNAGAPAVENMETYIPNPTDIKCVKLVQIVTKQE